jgi:hypothetical protein
MLAGYVSVVQTIDVYTSAGGGTLPEIFFEGAHGETFWFQTGSLTASSYGSYRGKVVLNGGENLTVHPNGGTWDVNINGYRLLLP